MTPKIYAHRGASGDAPENTLAAFQLALEQNADGVELDVTLTKDGHIVVIHDDTVDRTTDGKGAVKDLSLAQVQSLNAGQEEHIPTLEEVLDRFGGKYRINIELKSILNFSNPLPLKVAEMVNTYGLMDSIIVSSFNPFSIRRFHRQSPGTKIGLLTLPKMASSWLWHLFSFDALHPYHNDVDQDLVDRIHKENKEMNVWTVDSSEEIKRLASLQVDGIITNHPLRAREVLEGEL